MRLRQRGLSAGALTSSVGGLEIIESYLTDKYLPSFLLRGETQETVFHAQIAVDMKGNNVRVVTMYIPDPDEWSSDLRTRRTEK